jgi:hypothetical protein
MHLKIAIIDYLDTHGKLTTYVVRPGEEYRIMLVDRLKDVFGHRYSSDDVDIGGTRIYNSSLCSIEKLSARIRDFKREHHGGALSFQFEHVGIPIGFADRGECGIYNLVLTPSWRLRKLRIFDPNDSRHHSPETKKQFMHEVIWDTHCTTQVVEMMLDSERGPCSFVLRGNAVHVGSDEDLGHYLQSRESERAVSDISENILLDDGGKCHLANEIAKKAGWLELKPNLFGIGININEIINDSICFLKRKFKHYL